MSSFRQYLQAKLNRRLIAISGFRTKDSTLFCLSIIPLDFQHTVGSIQFRSSNRNNPSQSSELKNNGHKASKQLPLNKRAMPREDTTLATANNISLMFVAGLLHLLISSATEGFLHSSSVIFTSAKCWRLLITAA
ncbi:hypothetical protein CEXT_621561 [Caerostris extrusa]|uniref:Uncharacterized protein n=1 Tax=Caerostris extrusa TaxID=172846 RepID=A0AAV4XDH3_CAEEX|nr:hypothetical protein CEXT_621561 [Caerostris extrusa]